MPWHDNKIKYGKLKGIEGESKAQTNVSASWGRCKPDTSSPNQKITPELRTERRNQVGSDGSPVTGKAYDGTLLWVV